MPRLLAWIGRFSARHRIVVVVGWLLTLAAFGGVTATGGGGDDPTSAPAAASTRASEAMATVGEKFPDFAGRQSGDSLTLVAQAPDDGTVDDPATAADIEALVSAARDVDHVVSVTDPFDPTVPKVSEDRTTVISTITFDGMTEDEKVAAYDAVVGVADGASSIVTAEVGGALVEPPTSVGGIGEITGVLVAFVVLFLTFGSMLAAGANMLVAISGVAVGVTGILAYGAVRPIESTTITLATMLGLAVGIDYTLFILTRFRNELRTGRDVVDAIGRAVGTAGTAVVFAGLTVIIALAGMSVVGISSISDMGIAGAFGVAIAVLMALTLLPVILRTLGHRLLPKKDRQLEPTDPDRSVDRTTLFYARWAELLVRRPVSAIVTGVAVLLIVALPTVDMTTAQSVPGGMDPASTERAAYDLVVEEFGGIQSPLLVIAEGTAAPESAQGVRATLGSLAGVESVDEGRVAPSGDAMLFTVVPTGGPIDDSTKSLVSDIRDRSDLVPDVHLEVTGETAMGIDGDAQMQQALIKYLVVIIVMSVLLMMVMFRSILVPLVATVGFLLSVGSAFGGSVAVFQWGWLDTVIPAPQGDPMLSILPIILVGVLFGLAMDYQVFLVSRIHEMHARGMSSKQAIVTGFTRSAPVLVSAAAIMVFVFAGFASSTMAVAASIAFGLVIGVLADAFIVRLMLMPAALALMGDAAWWLPRWLARILPDLDVEGRALDRTGNDGPGTERDSDDRNAAPGAVLTTN